MLALIALAPAVPVVRAATDQDRDGLSDAFERNKSHTDPTLADTDGNGIPDGAEDPDGDGLSNLGEQRFHTLPLFADSNANGVPDGRDDANHDGVRDGVEQDRGRLVPSNLVPSLKNAAADKPLSYADGCHVGGWEHAFRECDYGSTNGVLHIAIFGDSHAAQWLPALITLANQRNWTIDNLTRSACPSADIHMWSVYQKGADTWCTDYRTAAVAWLNTHRPDVIVLANLAGARMVDAAGHFLPTSQRPKAWKQGFRRIVAALPSTSRVVILADTPNAALDPVSCLKAHPTSLASCERSRAQSIPAGYNAINAAVAARYGASFQDLNGVACPYDPCPIVVGKVLMFRVQSHFTATFSRTIAPALGKVLDAVLATAAIP